MPTTTYHITSEQDTVNLAADIATNPDKWGRVLFLQGDLGAGKTRFTRALAESLGITQPVKSPTFVLMNEYDIPAAPQQQPTRPQTTLLHIDLYRLEHPEIDADIIERIQEAMTDPQTLLVIEWAERLEAAPIQSNQATTIHIAEDPDHGPEARQITITTPNA